jgi:hypothetical protein
MNKQLANLSESEKKVYYSTSPFYSLKSYGISKIIKSNPDFVYHICDFISDYAIRPSVVHQLEDFRGSRLFREQLQEDLSSRQIFHLECLAIGFTEFAAPDVANTYNKLALRPDWSVPGYTNGRYYRDHPPSVRQKIVDTLKSCTHKLSFKVSEFEDFFANALSKNRVAEEERSIYKFIFKNNKYFENSKLQKTTKVKRPEAKQIANAVHSFSYRSATTSNQIVAGAGTKLLKGIVDSLPKSTCQNVETELSQRNLAKFRRALHDARVSHDGAE